MKKTTVKITKTNSWFLEKINKIDNPLPRFIKEKGERIQTDKIINEKEPTTDTAEIQRIKRDYHKQIFAPKLIHLKKHLNHTTY